MKVRITTLCLALMLTTQQASAVFGLWEQTTGKHVEGMFKKFGKKIGKLVEISAKEEARASGLLGNLDLAARSVFKGVASAGATALRHPSLLLLGTGIALYYSPRLREYTFRGIQFCYNAYARKCPNHKIVRAVNYAQEFVRSLHPEAVREAAAAEAARGLVLAGHEADAQIDRVELQQLLNGFRERIATLETANQNLQRQLAVEADRKTAFDQLGAEVPDLIQRVSRIDNEFGKQFNGDADQPGILKTMANLAKTMEVHTQQFARFSDLLNQTLNTHKKDTENFVNHAMAAHAADVGKQLQEHDTAFTQRLGGSTQELLAKFAALNAAHETTQKQVISLHAAIMDRLGQDDCDRARMEDID